MDLASKKCMHCEGGTKPLDAQTVETYLKVVPGWEVLEGRKIRRLFKFKDFKEAMDFVNQIAGLAESEGHHPDIKISYNKVKIELTTHAIGGLSENDFILATKIDSL